ncbi:MAG: MEDS domain-containing protein [Chitinophagaceae bacterium]|nr:MEDS domain-containing protein [Chitinophagaceae bacterium]
MKHSFEKHKWKRSAADNFWLTLAPCDHVIHIYEDDQIFTAMLTAFVRVGLQTNNGAILIASTAHQQAVEQRLKAMNMSVDPYLGRHYFPVDAQSQLSSIMVNGLPDEALFTQAISRLLEHARQSSRKVFVFLKWLLYYGARETIQAPMHWRSYGTITVQRKYWGYYIRILSVDLMKAARWR